MFNEEDPVYDSDSEPSVSNDRDQTTSKSTDVSPTTRQPERDEVKEIEKASKKDTNVIKAWRFLLILTLSATACAVTLVTYRYLDEAQTDASKESFEKFSETIGVAAMQQQKNVRDGFEAFANILTASSQSANAVWPYYTLPLYETYARYAIEQTGVEIMVVNNVVPKSERVSYEAWTAEHYYEAAMEAHMIRNGNLDQLPDNSTFIPHITRASPDGNIPDIERESYFAVWNWSPPPFSYGVLNWNPASLQDYDHVLNAALTLKYDTVWTKVRPYATAGVSMSQEQHDALHSVREGSKSDHPHSFVWHPVHEKIDDFDSKIVAVIGAGVAWDVPLRNLLPDTVTGIYAVISNSCNQSYTYLLEGSDALYIGEGDLHDHNYDSEGEFYDLSLGKNPEFATTPGHCLYSLTVYPSSGFVKGFDKNTPEIFAAVVACTFLLVGAIFIIYDVFVERRNKKLIQNSARTNAIVTQLFPGKIRDQLLQDDKPQPKQGTRAHFKSVVSGNTTGMDLTEGSKPLAELFLETTVLFADIVGFTAWSSTREPSHVFQLLESVYKEFDEIAKKRRVFKVETVGDCYVAAVGIPEYRRDGAVVMMRFASDIISAMDLVTKNLEVSLGPDTGDLALRIGIHSGAVTAGVLRGERARFQLFGDTMNTTARLESTGAPGAVHLSKETAELLIKAGKGAWIEPRKDMVEAKGKGKLQTFWLKKHFRRSDTRSTASSDQSTSSATTDLVTESRVMSADQTDKAERTKRLISWNVEILLTLLKQVIAHRNARIEAGKHGTPLTDFDTDGALSNGKVSDCLGEVQEIIALPEYDNTVAALEKDPEKVVLDGSVRDEMRAFVTCIASMYRDNAFHNFEHASHVLMSVTKLMSRIIAPSELEHQTEDALHDHTYGITSDPLTQFSCAFSALIHDADHEGVPNAQLVKEKAPIASAYKNRSVAEQNSLDLSWCLLMDDQFQHLRKAICATKEEFHRFRQLIVNSIMATDIADKDLKTLRNERWTKAFSECKADGANERASTAVNRKATIVIEHLIQASDVAHTMQHWHVYRKWNQRLFEEMVAAYKNGRSEKHPVEFWYKGEIGFFDFYIIPLAKKLKDCGVFGVSSGEYLDYATRNRDEWMERGQEVVAEMMAKLEEK
mmetsp:Transcript_18107/g.36476  ORF Transcript_18107/g.36476 Transcript_18107/m.36476 type:complete len:1137 (+) Transcript_18107:96-3506(+)